MDFSRTQGALQITKGTPEHTRISLTSPPILQKDSLVEFRSYRVYAMDAEPFEWMEGRPAIPQVTQLYHVPNTGSVYRVVNHSGFELADNVDVLPTQVETKRFPTDLYKDPAVYSSDGWYPAQPAVMSATMIYRAFRVVQVTLYPVQVNPRLRRVRVHQDLSAEIVANNIPGENELPNRRQPSGAFPHCIALTSPIWMNEAIALSRAASDGALHNGLCYRLLVQRLLKSEGDSEK